MLDDVHIHKLEENTLCKECLEVVNKDLWLKCSWRRPHPGGENLVLSPKRLRFLSNPTRALPAVSPQSTGTEVATVKERRAPSFPFGAGGYRFSKSGLR